MKIKLHAAMKEKFQTMIKSKTLENLVMKSKSSNNTSSYPDRIKDSTDRSKIDA